MAAAQLDTITLLRNLLTSPARLDRAVWETVQSVRGEEDWRSAIRVLFTPERAKPEDMKTFSERWLGLKSGWTKFLVDTATDPLVLPGLATSIVSLTMGKRALGFAFNRTAPNKVAHQFVNQYGAAMRLVTPYKKLLDGTLVPYAEPLIARRTMQTYQKIMDDFDGIRRSFGSHSEWERAKPSIAMLLDGRRPPRMSPEIRLAAKAWKEKVGDPMWDLVATIEEFGPKGMRYHPSPMNYLSEWLPRIATNKPWLVVSNRRLAKTWKRSKKARELQSIGQLKDFPVTVDDVGREVADTRRLLDWVNEPGAARLFKPYRLKRQPTVLDDATFMATHVTDLDKITHAAAMKVSKTYALQVPLSGTEVNQLLGHKLGRTFRTEHDPAILPFLNRQWRLADAEGKVKIQKRIDEFFNTMPNEQASLLMHFAEESRRMFGIKSPLGLLGKGAAKRVRAKDYGLAAQNYKEYLDLVVGKFDPNRAWTGRLFMNITKHASRALDGSMAKRMDVAGELFGEKNLGSKLSNHLRTVVENNDVVSMERMVANWTYGTTLGARLMPALVNLTQVPLVLTPTIGLGNVLAGVLEGGPKFFRAVKDAALEGGKHPRMFTGALDDAMRKHMPEYVAAGMTVDFRAMELAGQAYETKGVNGLIQTMLIPFQLSEDWNRIVSFYGGRHMYDRILKTNPKAFGYDIQKLSTGEARNIIDNEAAKVAMDTQFIPGAGRMAPLQKYLPPTFRQFSTYPISFSNWLLDAATKGAIDVRAEALTGNLVKNIGRGRGSWLPYARWATAAGGMINFGRDVLGVGVEDRLLGGIFNLPLASQPFAPLPLPPIPGALVSMPGNLVNIMTGDYQADSPVGIPWLGEIPIPRAFVPFGMASSHAYKMLNQVQDGLMLDREGRGQYNFDQKHTLLQAMGFTPVGSTRDKLKAKQLVWMEQKLKRYRHQLARAMVTGDTQTMQKIQQQYAKEYKGAPPLVVKKQDMRRVIDQEKTTRLYRQLQSSPRYVRDIVDPDHSMWSELIGAQRTLVQSIPFK